MRRLNFIVSVFYEQNFQFVCAGAVHSSELFKSEVHFVCYGDDGHFVAFNSACIAEKIQIFDFDGKNSDRHFGKILKIKKEALSVLEHREGIIAEILDVDAQKIEE